MSRPLVAAGAASVFALPAAVVGVMYWAAWTSATAPPQACVRPADHGAVPDDGQDDRAALQAALDAAVARVGCIDLSAGRWDVTRRPEAFALSYPSLVARGPVRITGGTLAMLGSAVREGETAPADWVLLEVSGQDVTIDGVSFDGADRIDTGEQTHLLQVRGPAERVTVERSTFNLPGLGVGIPVERTPDGGLAYVGDPSPAGDCIRLFGEADRRVRDVTIRHVRAPACFRSFLGVQRGVHGVVVEHVETVLVGDQAVDFEPTGFAAFNCQPIVSDLTIRHSVFQRGVDRGITMTIAGDQCAVADRILVADCIIEDGGIDLLDVGRVVLERLRVESARGEDAQPTLLARKRVGSLVVRDSKLIRSQHERPHPVVQISAQGPGRPTAAWFVGVTIEQHTPRSAIRVEGLGSLVVREASLFYVGDGGDWAIGGTAGSVTLADVAIHGRWRGPTGMNATHIRTWVTP